MFGSTNWIENRLRVNWLTLRVREVCTDRFLCLAYRLKHGGSGDHAVREVCSQYLAPLGTRMSSFNLAKQVSYRLSVALQIQLVPVQRLCYGRHAAYYSIACSQPLEEIFGQGQEVFVTCYRCGGGRCRANCNTMPRPKCLSLRSIFRCVDGG